MADAPYKIGDYVVLQDGIEIPYSKQDVYNKEMPEAGLRDKVPRSKIQVVRLFLLTWNLELHLFIHKPMHLDFPAFFTCFKN